jgi:hypothetical protein
MDGCAVPAMRKEVIMYKLQATPGGDTRAIERLDLKGALTKDSLLDGTDQSYHSTDGTVSDTNLPWHDCLHNTDATNPFWAVDLGESVIVAKVKLYGCNGPSHQDYCKDKLSGVSLYLGEDWGSYAGNTMIAENLDVPKDSPLEQDEIGKPGRYLWVARPGKIGMTLCEVQVWKEVDPNGVRIPRVLQEDADYSNKLWSSHTMMYASSGAVHGLWGSTLGEVERLILLPYHTQMRITLRYYAFGAWDKNWAKMYVDGQEWFAKQRLNSLICENGFEAYDGTIQMQGFAGCFDTRTQNGLGWSSKGTASSLAQARELCAGYDYVSLECPKAVGFEVWCVNKISDEKLEIRSARVHPRTRSSVVARTRSVWDPICGMVCMEVGSTEGRCIRWQSRR